MKVFLIGSGGREHALAWKISQSPLLTKLYCAPGNPGIAQSAELVTVNINDHREITAFCKDKQIDLVIVGPEAPLVEGLADSLKAEGIKVFGPSKAAAQLEGSKGFTKDICAKNNVPSGYYARFHNPTDAKAYIEEKGAPIVVKADGLAAGKGVVVAMDKHEALAAVDACFNGAFGSAGTEVVVEEYLDGEEASFFCLCDGEKALILGSAQDHKRVSDGDTGPNTGGMGAYTPAPVMTASIEERALHEIVEPTLKGMKAIGAPFVGVLFVGLMITKKGPEVIEYNVRFGDPECQVLMMRLESDLLELLLAAVDGNLDQVKPVWSDDAVLTVVMAAENYPDAPIKGTIIKGVEAADALENVKIFQAGTTLKDGQLIANGGRVLNVTARGKTVKEAQKRAYEAITKIDWPGGFYRHDIGWRAVAREK